MRPLAIWAMQWALTSPTITKPDMNFEGIKEDHLYAKQHEAFSRVANFLKLQKEEPKGLVQLFYELTCKRLVH